MSLHYVKKMKLVVFALLVLACIAIVAHAETTPQWIELKRIENALANLRKMKTNRPTLENNMGQLVKKLVRKEVNKAWKKIEKKLTHVEENTVLRDFYPQDHDAYVRQLEEYKLYMQSLDEYLKRGDISDEVYIRKVLEREKFRRLIARLERFVARS